MFQEAEVLSAAVSAVIGLTRKTDNAILQLRDKNGRVTFKRNTGRFTMAGPGCFRQGKSVLNMDTNSHVI